jgi:hypothetical protein
MPAGQLEWLLLNRKPQMQTQLQLGVVTLLRTRRSVEE